MTGHATAHGSAPIRNSMIVVMKARVVREEYSIHHASFQEPRVMAKGCRKFDIVILSGAKNLRFLKRTGKGFLQSSARPC